MKKIILTVLLFILISSAYSGILVIEGKYQNKNIYVQNTYGGSGVGYCAQEVKVNGNITTDEVNSSAFEIDLLALKLKYGDKVTIEIIHKDFCKPFVLNAQDLKCLPTFELLSMNINNSGKLTWTAGHENGPLPYIVEQFKWNKWIPVGVVDGVGTPEAHDYEFQVAQHSGENKFRVKQVGFGSLPKYSSAVVLNSTTEKPNYALTKDYNALQFTRETAYELFDDYGIVKKGFGKEINIKNLKKGKYYLCFDNQITEFEKKRR